MAKCNGTVSNTIKQYCYMTNPISKLYGHYSTVYVFVLYHYQTWKFQTYLQNHVYTIILCATYSDRPGMSECLRYYNKYSIFSRLFEHLIILLFFQPIFKPIAVIIIDCIVNYFS